MNSDRKIQKALISVYDKNLILDIANELVSLGVEILSTGGTQQYLGSHNIPVTAVEDLTGYPSIFGGRVKTLHPKIMGGILYRREEASDVAERERYDIPGIDLVIVDLYPFEEYVAKDASEEDIIEKIDIGGISLIRAAAKNYNDVIIVAGKHRGQTGLRGKGVPEEFQLRHTHLPVFQQEGADTGLHCQRDPRHSPALRGESPSESPVFRK